MSTPSLSPAQRQALTDIRDHQLYVGRDPGSPDNGSGIYPATLRKLLKAGLIARGPYEPGKGRRLALTPDGREAAGPAGGDA
ncbi:hypothetical protein ACWERV_17145 [Streptomyces sp. NPDC004031]